MKGTIENPRGSVKKLSPKESVEGGNTALRGSVSAPKGFYEVNPEAEKPRKPHTAPRYSVRVCGQLVSLIR